MQLGARHSLRNGSYSAVRFGRAAHQLHPQHLTRAASGTCRTPDYCNGQRWCHRPASISNLKFVLQIYFGRKLMKLLRRQLLHLAAGAVALPAISSIARAQTYPSRPNHDHRTVRGGRGDGYDRARDGRANEKLTWSTRHCGGRDWHGRYHRRRPSRTRGTRRLHARLRRYRLTRRDRCYLCTPV